MLKIVSFHNHFGAIAAQTMANLDQVVRGTAQTIRSDAAAAAPVDTSALQNSIYVSDDQGSDYGARAAMAASLRHSGNRPGSPAVIVPEEKPTQPHEAIIGSAVAHAVDNELGTSKMPARPYLTPAVANAAAQFDADVAAALR